MARQHLHSTFYCTQANTYTVIVLDAVFSPFNKYNTIWNIFTATTILLYFNSKISQSSHQTSLLQSKFLNIFV